MSDERVWLRNPRTGGHFHCPADAVDEWTGEDMGWEPTDGPPDEHNPVVAEALAQRQAAAEQAAADEKTAKKSTSRKSGADTTPQEG